MLCFLPWSHWCWLFPGVGEGGPPTCPERVFYLWHLRCIFLNVIDETLPKRQQMNALQSFSIIFVIFLSMTYRSLFVAPGLDLSSWRMSCSGETLLGVQVMVSLRFLVLCLQGGAVTEPPTTPEAARLCLRGGATISCIAALSQPPPFCSWLLDRGSLGPLSISFHAASSVRLFFRIPLKLGTGSGWPGLGSGSGFGWAWRTSLGLRLTDEACCLSERWADRWKAGSCTGPFSSYRKHRDMESYECVLFRTCGIKQRELLLTRLTSSTVMGCVRYRAPFCLRLSGGPSGWLGQLLPGRDSLLKRANFSVMLSLQLSSTSSAGSTSPLWDSVDTAGLGSLRKTIY